MGTAACVLPTQHRIAAPGRALGAPGPHDQQPVQRGKGGAGAPLLRALPLRPPPLPFLTSPLFSLPTPWLPRAPLLPPPPPRCCWRAAPPRRTSQTAGRASRSSKAPSAAADGPKGAYRAALRPRHSVCSGAAREARRFRARGAPERSARFLRCMSGAGLCARARVSAPRVRAARAYLPRSQACARRRGICVINGDVFIRIVVSPWLPRRLSQARRRMCWPRRRLGRAAARPALRTDTRR